MAQERKKAEPKPIVKLEPKKRVQTSVEQKPKKEVKVLQEKTWELTEYKNSILVSFAFNLDFKEYIKELGGKWMVSKKSWMFPKAESESIIEQISEKFPDWKKL